MSATTDPFADQAERVLGRSARRPKTEQFIRGRGTYVADVRAPRMKTCVLIRSPHPHARIASIDASEALRLDGVELVVTGGDLIDVVGRERPLWQGPEQKFGPGMCLAVDTVRYVGEPVAAVVASDSFVAADAAELVRIEYEPLAIVANIDEALAPDAPLLHPEWGDNVACRVAWPVEIPGMPTPVDADAAMEGSAFLVRETFVSPRISGVPMETRGVVAEYEPATEALTVHTSTQSVHQIREAIAYSLNVPEHRIRVIAPDVGGGFGSKAAVSKEEVLVAHLAVRTRGAVRWIESRQEFWNSTYGSRGQRIEIEVGFDEDGLITGIRGETLMDIGAEPAALGVGAMMIAPLVLCGPYRVPAFKFSATAVVTNRLLHGSYRAYGQPEGAVSMEKLMTIAARRMGIDPMELRRRNLLRPDELPHAHPTGLVMDSGRYAELLEMTAQAFDYDAELEAAAAARAEGRLVGVGMCSYTEITNFGPTATLGPTGINASGWDSTTIRIEPDGHVRVLSSQTPMGQGLELVLAQVAADTLGVPLEHISVTMGDTLTSPYTGYASGGSRGAGVAGSSVLKAGERAIEKMRLIAAHKLEARVDDVECVCGEFRVPGAPESRLSFADVARVAYFDADLPEGCDPGIEISAAYEPENLAFSYGHLMARVEVDPETGTVDVQRVGYGHDCGVQLNPQIVEGQVTGALIGAIGVALLEHVPYAANGEPLVRTFNDYSLPVVSDLPELEMVHLETPSPFSLNGAKGVGECALVAGPAAIVNAVQDALPADAALLTEMPLWPSRILAAMAGEKRSADDTPPL